MKRVIIIISAVVALNCQAREPMSIDSCINLAIDNNHKLSAAYRGVAAAQYDVRRARSYFFPAFSATGTGIYSTANGHFSIPSGQLPVAGDAGLTGESAWFPGYTLDYKVKTVYKGGLKFEQPIYFGGKIKTGYEMSKLGLEMSRMNVRKTRAEIIVETVNAYADVVRCDNLLSLARSYKSLLSELYRVTESAVRNGMKPRNDLLRVKVKLEECDLNIVKAQNGRRLAAMMFSTCLGIPYGGDITVDAEMPEVPDGIPTTEDYRNRPEYRLLEMNRELSRKNIALAKSEQLPQIGMSGSYAYTHGLQLNGSDMAHKWNFFIGVNVDIPIYHFGERINKVRASQARFARTCDEMQHAEEMMRLDMMQAYTRLEESRMAYGIAESGVRSAEENLRMSDRMYQQGSETLADLLDAQTAWLEMSQNLVEASVDRYCRWIEYQRSAGNLASD